ncbi:VWA domain-containing protein [Hyphobacterium sp. HN65]|uniref:VWA domain-containing protein n=1 Tax=Hyphobacterium lacteum TaxID=3116575 RepID=A0ABU7LQX0_9PROT|nr:VWA domain-containing protein [Hyphobacterium sp. HN65]MEE2525719.1 VWA domain-containing protein [Hyphobacterium sp. HN65]
MAAVIGIAVFASAHDTKDAARIGEFSGHVADRDKWHAIYYCHGSTLDNCRENEHAWLAQTALDRAAPRSPWNFSADDDLFVLDLATGYFRPEIAERPGSSWDPDDVMGLPQRRLPGPANFAGVPDFSYTMYDWINRNTHCPPAPGGAMPAGVPGDCHNYTYWQGGGFNASHFGSQATRSYLQLHQTALSLAARARLLRSRISGDPANLEAYRDVIREAEHEALAYEAYAQHFLQDRWAMGHMFERWGSPEYNANGIGWDPTRALLAGGFTGIIHGHQSVTHVPDALSSPEVGATETITNLTARALTSLRQAVGLVDEDFEVPAASIYIPVWRHANEEETHPGVGDYRAWDMMRLRYAARLDVAGHLLEYNSETALPVQRQRRELLACSTAGYREVIAAFGQNSAGYGIDDVALSPAAGESLGDHCFDTWATNESMVAGMGPEFIAAGGIATLSQALVRIGVYTAESSGQGSRNALPPELRGLVYTRNDTFSLTRIYVQARLAAYRNANGIDLAQGGMGALSGVPTGDTYPIASYLEPGDLTTLPDSDPRGRDAETIFGFYNRSHADYFCRRSEELLDSLRGSSEDSDRATCRIMAQRLYEEARGDGPDVEEYSSVILNGSRERTEPLCRLASEGWAAPHFGGDRIDILHPGYVPWDFAADESRSFAMDDAQLSYQSVANWCDRTPVIDARDEEDLLAASVVAVIENTRDTLEIRGRHFGDSTGHLAIGLTPDSAIPLTEILSWSDTRIRFRVEAEFDQLAFRESAISTGGFSDSHVFITRAGDAADDPGQLSAGRFVIRREVRPPRLTRVEVTAHGEDQPVYFTTLPEPPSRLDEEAGWLFEPTEENASGDAETAFRPVQPGARLTIELTFDEDIDRDAEGQIISLGGEPLEGRWTSRRRWRGERVIADGDAFDALRGPQTLEVYVQSERGAWTDGDPESPGSEPDRETVLLYDRIPVVLESIEVRADGQNIYGAEWTSGPDYEGVRNLTLGTLDYESRILDITEARAVPASGTGRMRLEFSMPLDDAPTIRVGGSNATVSGEGRRWRAQFDVEEAASLQDSNGDIQITVGLTGQALDADPATPAAIAPPDQWSNGTYWADLDQRRGGPAGTDGGEDVWHRLGEPPALSLLVILDASGSMRENDRMTNARAGINQTFESLPPNQVIEFAAVAFQNCGSFTTRTFTRDAEAIRSFLTSIEPGQGTPLAVAHDQARAIFLSQADPRAAEWRYASFTDGAETCDGNVASSIRNLEAVLSRHRAPDRSPPEPNVAPAPERAFDCRATTGQGYSVEVTDGGRHLDRITLVEHTYLERALPDGRCIASFETREYGVYYGRTRSSGLRWGINSQPSDTRTLIGRSSRGEADLLRVRGIADAAGAGLVDLPTARREIERAVQAAEPEEG